MDFAPNYQPNKVLGLWCTPHLACAYYRIVAPLSVLPASWCAIDKVTEAQIDAAETVVLVRPSYAADEQLALIRDLQQRGKRVLVDYDDDYFSTWPEFAQREEPRAVSRVRDGVKVALSEADGVIVPNYHLMSRYISHTDKPVYVSRQSIRADWWPERQAAKHHGPMLVGLFGSASHDEDYLSFLPTLRQAKAELGDALKIWAVGYIPKAFDVRINGAPLLTGFTPWVEHRHYAGIVNLVDMLIAPLNSTLFNRSKSEGRALEAAMAELPFVGSRTVYERALHPAGLPTCSTPADWLFQLSKYALSAEARKQDAATLRRSVLQRYDARYRVDELTQLYLKEA